MGTPAGDYTGYTIDQVYDAIEAGDPLSFKSAQDAFSGAWTTISNLVTDIPATVGQTAGVEGKWKTGAADAFTKAAGDVVDFLNKSTASAQAYDSEIGFAWSALDAALRQIGPYKTNVDTTKKSLLPNQTIVPDPDTTAQGYLNALAGEYADVIANMKPVPPTPNDLKKQTGNTTPGGSSDTGAGKNKDNKNKDNKNKDNKKNDDNKNKDNNDKGNDSKKNNDAKKNNDDKPSSGGDSGGKSSGGDSGGKKDHGSKNNQDGKQDDGKQNKDHQNSNGNGSDSGSPAGGSSPGGGSPGGGAMPSSSPSGTSTSPGTSGTDPNQAQPGMGQTGTGQTTAGTPGATPGAISDHNRALPNGMKPTTANGVTGFDIDHDGKPDIGTDGRPLPGAHLVTKDGLTGVDLNGDGKPDIGMDGQLLTYDRLVQGPDGALGIDVNGDGTPDIAISGQVLPDAPVVSHQGITGIDVNGDGVPDIGLDGHPLHDMKTVTFDGVSGIDVNGDGKPDILPDGTFTKYAPIVELPNGIKGIDVNGDCKPDIAVHGGITLPVPRGAAAMPVPAQPQVVTTPTATMMSSNVPAVATGQLIGDPNNPGTVLTSAGRAPATAPAPATPGAPAAGGTATGGYPSGVPMVAGAPGAGGHATSTGRHAHLVEEEDAWYEDASGTTSVLGRPV